MFYGFFVDHGRFRLIVGIQNLLFNVCCKRRGDFDVIQLFVGSFV